MGPAQKSASESQSGPPRQGRRDAAASGRAPAACQCLGYYRRASARTPSRTRRGTTLNVTVTVAAIVTRRDSVTPTESRGKHHHQRRRDVFAPRAAGGSPSVRRLNGEEYREIILLSSATVGHGRPGVATVTAQGT